jgi:ubiquinone/menaquinone biosynthesis C-methylase UbiE
MHRYYLTRPSWRDGTAEFRQLIQAWVPSGAKVLELGCGPTNDMSFFLAETSGILDGLDVDDACRENAHIRNAYVYDGTRWPLPDASYDAVVCNYVLEHVASPSELAGEIRRVLRPGGTFAFRTPNRWHYVTLVSRWTPHWVHERLANRLRNLEEEASDPYPTFYRMNSLRSLRSLFSGMGFDCVELRTIEKEPSYGMSSQPLFLLFMLYERIMNSAEEFSWGRSNILGAFRRQAF